MDISFGESDATIRALSIPTIGSFFNTLFTE